MELAETALRVIGLIICWLIVAIVALFVLRWAYSEWYITTHCTEVLGTRVCR